VGFRLSRSVNPALHWSVFPTRILASFFAAIAAFGANPALLTQSWQAQWITVPSASRTDYGVYHFRRAFTLPAKPASFVVHVSGDNRYVLYVNGQRVSEGPARGDLFHWRYETLDLAPHLNAGKNVLAAAVWNFGADAPLAQVTNETGFLLQGDTAAEQAVNTGRDWKCAADAAYSPIPVRMGRDVAGYYVAGPGERVDGARYPWDWEKQEFDDSAWSAPRLLGQAAPREARDAHSYWMMVPRKIPLMEESAEPALRVRMRDTEVLANPPEYRGAEVPANSKATLVLDQGYYTTGYPELTVSGGRGAIVSLKYAESLYQPNSWIKGNRNDVQGKQFKGYQDIFIADGGDSRVWRPLWWRTWRYIELSVETAAQPLRVNSLNTKFSGYPFVRRAKFSTSDPAENAELQRMLEVSWRTLRVDAHETFMDCAYYEQLQYIGDTRLEALTTLTLSGDPRLVKNALETLQDTQTADGLTFSRGPSRLPQYIPEFSLYWIGMLHDYWMYQDDPEFVRHVLPAARGILAWFASHQKANGSLGPLPWWNYVDWVRSWRNGVPPVTPEGSSSILDLLLLAGYQWAADMERALGSNALAGEYSQRAAALAQTVRTLYWDSSRGLFADTPEKKSFSQHPNAFAIVTGLLKGEDAGAVAARLIEDKSLTESTIYFRYYVHTAMLKAGLGDRFLDQLGTWRDALKLGLTTWPESPEPSRSDAHAWSSHITIDFFRTMLGIEPAAPGFAKVRIAPHLGKLADLSGSMPHPKGEIAVDLKRAGSRLTGRVTLPAGVTGEFVDGAQTVQLHSGTNQIR
jgi:alpha-L-rhamnosidase